MFKIHSKIKKFVIKKSDFLTYVLNLRIGAMENLDLMSVVFREFSGFLDHLLINVRSDDVELFNVSFLLFVAKEKLCMPSMPKSPIKAKLSVLRELVVDFLGEDRNMADHESEEKYKQA